jgi:hypothetical protein
MRRREQELDAGVRADLEALDAALRGEDVAVEHAPLAALTSTLVELRPEPSAEFGQALAERAADRFARKQRSALRGPRSLRAPRRRSHPDAGRSRHAGHGLRSRPAIATAAAGLVALAVAAAATLPGAGGGSSRHASSLQAGRATGGTVVGPLGPVVQGAAGTKGDRTEAAPSKGGANAGRSGPAASSGSGAGTTTSGPALASPAVEPQPPTRQVERSALLDVGVPQNEIQATAQRVFALVSSFGGYVRSSNVASGEGEGEGGASFQARVPSGRLPAAIAALSHLGHVRSENENTSDVTEAYDSLQRSLGAARAQRTSLLRQLAATSEAARAQEIEARLRSAEQRIGELETSLHSLTARIDYTPLALSLTPEHAQGQGALGGLTPGDAAGTAARLLGTALAVLLVAAAAALPLAAIALAAWLALTLARRRLREQALDA